MWFLGAGRRNYLLGGSKMSIIIMLLSILLVPSLSLAEDIYVAQNTAGGGSGVDCASAHSALWFNTSSNWGTGTTRITSGTTVHLCGVITSTLTVQGSGSVGVPVTLLFEDGAKLRQPVCPGTGCLNTNNQTFLIIDGGASGVIESTNNGTALGYQLSSAGILARGCSNCEIKNLTIQNIYVRSSNADIKIDQTQTNCIFFSGKDINVHHNTCHDMGWALFNQNDSGDTNVLVHHNDIYNIDHGYILAGVGSGMRFDFYNNHVHDYAKWSSPGCTFHHDGIHAFGDGTHIVTDLWIYNNLFDGDVGTCPTGHIFLEGGSGAGRTPWTNSTGVAHVFNNVFISNQAMSGIVQLYKGTNFEVFNNTIIGPGSASGSCLGMDDTTLA